MLKIMSLLFIIVWIFRCYKNPLYGMLIPTTHTRKAQHKIIVVLLRDLFKLFSNE